MVDVHSPETRSYNMSMIRSGNTKPEMIVRRFLFSKGFRYRIHDKRLPGKPDIVLPKYKTVIFVHGCFWHGHKDCRYFVVPKTKTKWWVDKINGNKRKDSENFSMLKELDWHIITIFECALKKDKRQRTLNSLLKKLNTLL